ncbi:antirestriction protein ArdA [Gorillibacterium timonense]|uniref:antirestriction protein ArdA n=1 Tax=Gorillibacterium timonense TaxID=1689269 RepID=UPI00071DEEF5|nr:antirestriction protein ArdA [Gorillibacterium timonense]
MQIRICVARRTDGSNEKLHGGEWLSLPMPVNELDKKLRRIDGTPADWIITDWEAPFWIEPVEDVYWINEAAYAIAGYDKRLVYALCGCLENLDMLLTVLTTGLYYVHYDVQNLQDVAERLMQSGCYGTVPTAIWRYIDMDKLVQDLVNKGWHMQNEVNTAILPLP